MNHEEHAQSNTDSFKQPPFQPAMVSQEYQPYAVPSVSLDEDLVPIVTSEYANSIQKPSEKTHLITPAKIIVGMEGLAAAILGSSVTQDILEQQPTASTAFSFIGAVIFGASGIKISRTPAFRR